MDLASHGRQRTSVMNKRGRIKPMRLANIIPNGKKPCKKLKHFPGFRIAEINAVSVPSFIGADFYLFDE